MIEILTVFRTQTILNASTTARRVAYMAPSVRWHPERFSPNSGLYGADGVLYILTGDEILATRLDMNTLATGAYSTGVPDTRSFWTVPKRG